MKLKALCEGAEFGVDLAAGPDEGHFELALTDASGETLRLEVQVLSVEGDHWVIESDGRVHDLILEEDSDGARVDQGDWSRTIEILSPRDRLRSAAGQPSDDGLVTIRAQMPGKVVRVTAAVGDTVQAQDGVVVIEAMKMQNEIHAPRAGTVVACAVEEGQSVTAGDILFELE